jgi:hypothetical protein
LNTGGKCEKQQRAEEANRPSEARQPEGAAPTGRAVRSLLEVGTAAQRSHGLLPRDSPRHEDVDIVKLEGKDEANSEANHDSEEDDNDAVLDRAVVVPEIIGVDRPFGPPPDGGQVAARYDKLEEAEGDVQHLCDLADGVAKEKPGPVEIRVHDGDADKHDEGQVGKDGREEDKVAQSLGLPRALVEGGPSAQVRHERGQVGRKSREREDDVPVDEAGEEHLRCRHGRHVNSVVVQLDFVHVGAYLYFPSFSRSRNFLPPVALAVLFLVLLLQRHDEVGVVGLTTATHIIRSVMASHW